MLDKKILSSLLNCHSEEQIFDLLKDEEFPDLDGSKFRDDIFRFKTSTFQYMNMTIRNEGVHKLAFKVLLLLKLHGHIGNAPRNSGTRVYASTLSKILRELPQSHEKRLDEITFDRFIEYIKNINNDASPRTAIDYIMIIHDWIAFGNSLLPYILRLDERLARDNNFIFEIEKNASKKYKDYVNGIGGISKKLFPLADTKKIMQKALSYVESYAEEILLIAPILLKRKDVCNDYQERKYLVDYLKEVNHTFEEPELKLLQEDSHNLISHKITKPAIRILGAIRRLEGACIFLALSLTGYRASEFIRLPRFPLFRQEEHIFLSRLVTKTSVNSEGDDIEMPIPIAAKNAIEILSKLTSFLDGKKEGELLMNSWENKIIKNVVSASQRLSLAISYFCNAYNFPILTPHMTRHTMDFIIVYFSEGDSIELARLFLGHKSITMTLRYLGHYNIIYKEAIEEFEQNESQNYAKKIANEVRYGNKLYGKSGQRIINAQFSGIYVDEFADLLEVGLIEMVKVQQYIILNTPFCYCIHDKTTTKNMPCQQGLNLDDFEDSIEIIPLVGRCRPGACDNAVFTEEDISRVQANQLANSMPDEFRKRIMENIYFVKDEDLEELDNPLQKIIKQYNQDQASHKGA